jgi:hypothetical protein
MPHHPIHISTELQSQWGQEFIHEFADYSMLLTAVLSVIHPGLYQAGRESLRTLGENAHFAEVVRTWPSAFSGMQVIANRLTEDHRDGQSRAEWYDVLTTIGPYTGAKFGLSNIGVKLRYDSGTILGLGGNILRHNVQEFDGERVCFAYFVRANVHERMGIPNPGWSTVENIERRLTKV